MRKLVILASVVMLLLAFPLTTNAEESPHGTPYVPPQPTVVDEGVLGVSIPVVPVEDSGVLGATRSPKTGEDTSVLFVWGSAAVILAAGAAAAGKKSRA